MPDLTLSGWTEAEIISEIERAFALADLSKFQVKHNGAVHLGIGDDAALLRLKSGDELVVTTDSAVEGEDFEFSCFPLDAVGYRAVQQNLSDLAAMGAKPLAMLLTIAASPSTSRKRFKAIVAGLAQAASEAQCPLVGGDLSSVNGPFVLTLTLLGSVPVGQALRRSTARVGDDLWVSGELGAAACGLSALLQRKRAATSTPALLKPLCGPRRTHYRKFLHPQARLNLGLFLRRRASACMDLSDGLIVDAHRIANASKISLHIDSKRLPRGLKVPMENALFGGEDFELLFTAGPQRRAALKKWSRRHKLALTKIGTAQSGTGVFVDEKIVSEAVGFDHFS